MSAEVFISYAAKDRTRVLDLVDRLRTAGVSVWSHPAFANRNVLVRNDKEIVSFSLSE